MSREESPYTRDHIPEPEVERCEDCGCQALLMSVFTRDGWRRICAACYALMVVNEPTVTYKPSFWEKLRGILPDMRSSILEPLLRKIGRPICGHNQRCDLLCEECHSHCKIQEKELKEMGVKNE